MEALSTAGSLAARGIAALLPVLARRRLRTQSELPLSEAVRVRLILPGRVPVERYVRRLAAGAGRSLRRDPAAGLPALGRRERRAVVDAVCRALVSADLSDDRLLGLVDPGPAALAAHVDPVARSAAELSDDARAVHRAVLHRTSDRFLRAVEATPDFPRRYRRAERQRLRQGEESAAPAGGGRDPDDVFLAAYLDHVAQAFASVDLMAGPGRRRVATVEDDDGPERTEPLGAVARHRSRLLLLGEAGSGKSTLLEGLAVSAARRAFTGDLADWNGLVPVLVRLRDHPEADLPDPGSLLDSLPGALPGTLPGSLPGPLPDTFPGSLPPVLPLVLPPALSAGEPPPRHWLDRRLAEGRVLLLLDGVDELAGERHQRLHAWLVRLLGAYPGNSAVVTTRPSAVAPDWLSAHGFTTARLAPLSRDELAAFVSRRFASDAALARELLGALDERLRLAELLTTPLLASLVCTQHARRRRLPTSRTEIYRQALELLADQRDADDRLPGALSLLSALAWHLTSRGFTAAPRTQVVDCLESLEFPPELDVTAEEALALLLDRSGVLTTTASGAVDFVHRVFLEYLAAEHAVDQDHVATLVRNAHLAVWHDTVAMASVRATERQRRQLLTGILRRADAERHQHRALRLLALSCLTFCREAGKGVPRSLTASLDHAVGAVLPPRRASDCPPLAAAPRSLLRALPSSLGELRHTEHQRLTVRTAALTGDREFLARLGAYAREGREPVARELVDGWHHFSSSGDAVRDYAREVLRHLPLDRREVRVTHPRQWQAAPELPHATRVRVAYPFGPDIGEVTAFPRLRRLRVTALADGADLRPLRGCPQLTHLWLWGTRLPDLGPLAELPRLTFLHLLDWPPFTLDGTPLPATLTTLSLGRLPLGAPLGWLREHPALTALALQGAGTPHWQDLAALGLLTELDLGGYDLTHALPALVGAAPGLRLLGLHGCSVPADLSPLAHLPRLTRLDLVDTTGPGGAPLDLAPLARAAPRLTIETRGATRSRTP
ncbi:NACHT domain-containing protein [Streptomyces sp. 4N509B]|uniref:NACHT domain-containing protein n=1 Tax=Streptomyces sp. 4N509B TaxID=3457413 RepID=UPI003FD62183